MHENVSRFNKTVNSYCENPNNSSYEYFSILHLIHADG